jgi:GNAT superfamily N-acetyltransferase
VHFFREMTMHYEFRKLGREDIASVYEIRFSVTENLIHAHQIKYLCREQLLEDIGQGGGWMCLFNGEKVGFSLGLFVPGAVVAALFVVPEHQGRGIGKRLLRLATTWLNERGAHRIMLETDPGSKADLFYQRQGWQRGELTKEGVQVEFSLTI